MGYQKYAVKLTAQERNRLEKFIQSASRKNTAQCKVHAKVLLCLDENSANPLTVAEASKKCKLHIQNVYNLRKQFLQEGMDRVLHRKKRETPPVPSKITGEVEAHIIATACSSAPEGRERWTMAMIAGKIVLDGVIDSISDETVRLVLKKHGLSRT